MPSRDQFTTEIYVNNQQAQDALKELNGKLEKLRTSYANLNKSSKNYETRERELAKQIEATERSIATAEKGTDSYRRAMENLSKRGIDQLIRMQRQLNSEIKKLDPNDAEFKKLSENYQRVTQRIKELKAAQEGVSAGGGGIFKKAGSWLSNYYGALVIGYQAVKRVAQGFMEAYKTISNFEQANANLASILGATSDQMEVLEKAAIQLGSSTRYSASQVTGLQTELAKLGFTVKEITDMSPAVLNFAGSVGTDLASAASLAGVALRSFNLGSEQTEDALGTMAVACNKSALSFEYLQNSFSTIAPVAKTYGLSLKDTIALLGTLANAGFDASSAATATRNILLNLSDTNGKLAKALGGSVHSFEDIMGAMKKLRDQGVDLNTTLELTDKRSVAAFNTFLDGVESAQTLRGELEDVNGELQRMAEQRANTVEGAIDGMKSAWEGLVLSFRNSTGTFAKVFKFLTDGINGIRDLIDPEGSIEERTAKMYAEVFRDVGNEFISIEETRERVWAKYQELEKSIREGGGGVVYKKHALEGLKKAYNEVMSELTEMAKAANEKVLEINSQYMNEEQKILKQQAKLTENGLNQSNKAAYDKLQDKLEANRKAWNQAVADATRFKEKMEDVVSGDTTTTTSGGGTGGGPTEKELAKMKQAYSQKKQMLDAALNYEEKQLKLQWLKNEIGEADYNSLVYQMKAKHYEALLELARKYGQEDSAIRNKMLDDQIKVLESEKKRVKEEMDEMARYYEGLRTGDERQFGASTGSAANGGIGDQEAYEAFQEKIWAKANEIKQSLVEDSARTEYETQMKWIEKLHKDGLLSDEEFEKAKLDQKLGFASKIAQEVNRYAEMASNFSNALKEAETAQLEAEYQAQLTAAGDNAEERERIEAEYEQKKLDMQKKYADTEMVINIAKAIAAGALAAIEAFAAAGNPILGAVFAAMIAATTALEVATIVKQRNAIKNSSVSGGSSSSAPSTGQRTITGHAKGGFTENHTTLSTVGEEGVEWIAPHWMVRDNPTTFANLERYRKTGSHGRSGSVSSGFADGGFTGATPDNITSGGTTTADIEAAVETAIERIFARRAIRAYVVRRDIKELDDQDDRLANQTSRG